MAIISSRNPSFATNSFCVKIKNLARPKQSNSKKFIKLYLKFIALSLLSITDVEYNNISIFMNQCCIVVYSKMAIPLYQELVWGILYSINVQKINNKIINFFLINKLMIRIKVYTISNYIIMKHHTINESIL